MSTERFSSLTEAPTLTRHIAVAEIVCITAGKQFRETLNNFIGNGRSRALVDVAQQLRKEQVRLRSSTASRALRTESEPQIS